MNKIYGLSIMSPTKLSRRRLKRRYLPSQELLGLPYMKRIILFSCLVIQAGVMMGQEIDSVEVLDAYTVQGYLYNRGISSVPAAVGVISANELGRFNNASLLPAINTLPGVRMEERSPASY